MVTKDKTMESKPSASDANVQIKIGVFAEKGSGKEWLCRQLDLTTITPENPITDADVPF